MSDIATRDTDGVRVLTITRSHRSNALTCAAIRSLCDALTDAEAVPSVRAVIITGENGRFSAGADLDELTGTIEDQKFDDELQRLTIRIQNSSMPVVAAVEGICFGAGIDLAWACDLQVVSASTRLALPAVRIGILYNPVSLARLHARLGAALVRRLLVLGEEISGDEMGVAGVAEIVAPGASLDTALARLAGGPESGEALRLSKAVLHSLDSGNFDPIVWQQPRRDLLASAGRGDILRATRLRVGRTVEMPSPEGSS